MVLCASFFFFSRMLLFFRSFSIFFYTHPSISHTISWEKRWPSIENCSIYGVIYSWFDELYCFHVRRNFIKCLYAYRTSTQMCNSHSKTERMRDYSIAQILQLNFIFLRTAKWTQHLNRKSYTRTYYIWNRRNVKNCEEKKQQPKTFVCIKDKEIAFYYFSNEFFV